MKVSGKINEFRRTLMRGLTQNIGRSHNHINYEKNANPNIKRVLIIRPNHRLGNLLLVTPLIQEISQTFPDCKIDLFVKGGLAPILFKNYTAVDRIIQLPKKPFNHLFDYLKEWALLRTRRYDLVINVAKKSSSGRMSTQMANAKYKIFGDFEDNALIMYSDREHMAKFPVYNFRHFLDQLGAKHSSAPVQPLELKLNYAELEEGRETLRDIVKNDKKTISIFTYATGSKCYSDQWWDAMYKKLQEEYKDYNIIEVLPVENVSSIGFKAPSFYTKDVRELGAVIAATDLFIGADSGIMHLASAVHTPTVGLFSVSNPVQYEPYGTNSLAINTNKGILDEYLKRISRILRAPKWTVLAHSVVLIDVL
jgi:ADP-heptose:LPS heptosyltransferase